MEKYLTGKSFSFTLDIDETGATPNFLPFNIKNFSEAFGATVAKWHNLGDQGFSQSQLTAYDLTHAVEYVFDKDELAGTVYSGAGAWVYNNRYEIPKLSNVEARLLCSSDDVQDLELNITIEHSGSAYEVGDVIHVPITLHINGAPTEYTPEP